MAKDSQPRNSTIVLEGSGQQDAVELGYGIFMSRDISNAYRVITDDGDVLVNTGFPMSGEENLRRLSAVSRNPVMKIIFTQSHTDHIGGWRWFNTPQTETIAHANFDHVYGYFEGLRQAMMRRSRALWNRDIREPVQEFIKPVVTTTFHDSYQFQLGNRLFELYSVPGGETLDSLVVWLPQDRVVFTGNLTGPIFGHVPNLYTLRGDKIRYVQWYLDSVQRVIDLNPQVLITGHGDPVLGESTIRDALTKMRDAVQFIKDRTFAGMNQGKDLWSLMEEISLPPELAIGQGHGKVPWLVRAIWEEHMGWFRFESTTELYNVPLTAVTRDFVELAGREPLLTRGQKYLEEGRPLHALHMAEAILSEDAGDLECLELQRSATALLLEQNGRENFSEVRWLESRIHLIEDAMEALKNDTPQIKC